MARTRRLRRRLESLSEREQQKRRELGGAIVRMHQEDGIDVEVVAERAQQVVGLQDEIAELDREIEADGRGDEGPGERDEHQARRRLGYVAGEPPAPGLPDEATEVRVVATPEDATVRSVETEAPRAASLDELSSEIEKAERRARSAPSAERPQDAERTGAEIRALEQDLESERRRAEQALGQLEAQLRDAEQRAREAEEARLRGEAEAKAAAAEWLRGQAAAMRREAEEQVRAELQTPEADENAVSELRVREAELAQERDAKSEALAAAERRLAEIETHAASATGRIESAERRLAEERERIEAGAEARLREEVEAARREAATEMQAKLAGREAELDTEMRGEAARIEAEAEARGREAAAAWLRGQVRALRREIEKELQAQAEQPDGEG
jgi:hypothetical protein